MGAYTLNLRAFWLLVWCLLGSLLLLHHSLQGGSDDPGDDCADRGPGVLSLLKYLLVFALCYSVVRYRRSPRPRPGPAPAAAPARAPASGPTRELLDEHFERHVRVSPHVLGHSKAHVAKLVSELVRAGRADGAPESSLAFRGDSVHVGSSYEEHKVGSPDCFDILIPLRLPQGLKLEPCSCFRGGPPLVSLEVPRTDAWPRRQRLFTDSFLRSHGPPGVYRLSPECVLRWFYGATQRCLAAVRYPFEQRCAISLSLGDGQRVQLQLTPRLDYVCCHISMGVRLIPALPLGDSGFLVAAPGAQRSQGVWTVYFPKQEQRLLGWLKGRLPPNSCHLKCIQLLKEVRDLGGRALDRQAGSEWRGVLSSYALKTAWLRLLLSTAPESWDDRYLLDRMEDLLRFLRDGLQARSLRHLLLGGDGALPESVALPKLVKDMVPSELWAEFSAESQDMVSARLSYCWAHLPRLIRLGRPQGSSPGRRGRCKHIDAE